MTSFHSGPPFLAAIALPPVMWPILLVPMLGLWLLLHRRIPTAVVWAIRCLVGFLAIWSGLKTTEFIMTLRPTLPLPVLGLLGGLAVEAVFALYRRESLAIRPRLAATLRTLRIAAVLLVLFLCAGPVLVFSLDPDRERTVAVLVDDSESMDLTDPQRDVKEWIEFAVFHGLIKESAFKATGGEKADPPDLAGLKKTLEAPDIERLEALKAQTRANTALRLLEGDGESPGLVERLDERYQVEVVRYASSPLPGPKTKSDTADEDGKTAPEGRTDWRGLTHLTRALEYPLDGIPPDQLAAVVLVGDLRDTSDGYPEDVARQMARRDVPVLPVLLGSQHGRRDLAVMKVDVPETIYKGERLRAHVDLKMDNMPGEETTIRFYRGDLQLEERKVSAPRGNKSFLTRVSFSDQPGDAGLFDYRVEVVPAAEEEITRNNQWAFRTAVSDDRTNVLLLGGRPGWEFRYLRNLFYGRDKSVHLQYVLERPDALPPKEGVTEARVFASASRPFGMAEANQLPATLEEWRKFDVIILGDVSPALLDATQLEHIRHCVVERGAALVVIAGPDYMPHAYDQQAMRDLLPAGYPFAAYSRFAPPEPAYHLIPTREGIGHPLMQLGSTPTESERIWRSMPEFTWRTWLQDVKPGATVLAYAEPATASVSPVQPSLLDPGAIAERIKERAERERRNALIVAQSYGNGRVLLMAFDRTWRLRYRIGDTLHHRFWGRVMAWGAGENLRAGTPTIRLGTDALSYGPDQAVLVTARLMDSAYRPIKETNARVELFRNGQRISSHPLSPRRDSQGLFDVEIPPLSEPGTYRIRLAGNQIPQHLAEQGAKEVETEFQMASSFNPVEWSNLSADYEAGKRIGGAKIAQPYRPYAMEKLVAGLREMADHREEPFEVSLWDHWLTLFVLIALLATEWFLRRKGGLT